jgi:hypothetical protein
VVYDIVDVEHSGNQITTLLCSRHGLDRG